ncbi:hypothetical protein HGRIS_001723 [Hohenbuehelia grisea]|uniref:Uncharacterized protein n=1 Tax=Hohenbuehelia grisea TaxID=104357 RepID=A0ABR3JJ98_9AGAR
MIPLFAVFSFLIRLPFFIITVILIIIEEQLASISKSLTQLTIFVYDYLLATYDQTSEEGRADGVRIALLRTQGELEITKADILQLKREVRLRLAWYKLWLGPVRVNEAVRTAMHNMHMRNAAIARAAQGPSVSATLTVTAVYR